MPSTTTQGLSGHNGDSPGETQESSERQDLDTSSQELPERATSETLSSSSVAETPTAPPACLLPQDVDVIFGRGEPLRRHPGNVRFRSFIRSHAKPYADASKSEKSVIIHQVTEEILASGARFLAPFDTTGASFRSAGCREATKNEVRCKISHALREKEKTGIRKAESTRLAKEQASSSASSERVQSQMETGSVPINQSSDMSPQESSERTASPVESDTQPSSGGSSTQASNESDSNPHTQSNGDGVDCKSSALSGAQEVSNGVAPEATESQGGAKQEAMAPKPEHNPLNGTHSSAADNGSDLTSKKPQGGPSAQPESEVAGILAGLKSNMAKTSADQTTLQSTSQLPMANPNLAATHPPRAHVGAPDSMFGHPPAIAGLPPGLADVPLTLQQRTELENSIQDRVAAIIAQRLLVPQPFAPWLHPGAQNMQVPPLHALNPTLQLSLQRAAHGLADATHHQSVFPKAQQPNEGELPENAKLATRGPQGNAEGGSGASKGRATIVPRDEDIVFGRGAPLRQHPGNVRFRDMVERYTEAYNGASKHQKSDIIRQVIAEIKNTTARFLMVVEGGFVDEASDDEVRMKVSHRFRDIAKTRARGPSKQQAQSKSAE